MAHLQVISGPVINVTEGERLSYLEYLHDFCKRSIEDNNDTLASGLEMQLEH